jgi:hypothetical protein
MAIMKSSDESMRMRVLGFAKAVANLEMENSGSMKIAFAATHARATSRQNEYVEE